MLLSFLYKYISGNKIKGLFFCYANERSKFEPLWSNSNLNYTVNPFIFQKRELNHFKFLIICPYHLKSEKIE